MIFDDVHSVILDDIFLRLDGFRPGDDVFLKLEGLNPAGSIKIKTAVALVASVENGQPLPYGTPLIESSSGNLGVALSVVCAAKRYRLTIVTDVNTTPSAVSTMRALGTEVIVVDEPDPMGGFLHTRINTIRRMLAADPRLVWFNQYANPANKQAHRDTTAASMYANLGHSDVWVVGVGTAGTLMGLLEFKRAHGLRTTVVAVDAAGSVTFGGPPGRRHIPGLGASRRPELYEDAGDFERVVVSEPETIEVCRLVARRYGLVVGGSTGSVLAAARRLECGAPGKRIAVVSPDMGEKYLNSIYSDSWVQNRYSASDHIISESVNV
ncbi:pyridoxal-phosphate dependent enzyme [Micromonospora sp. AKA38]|uniref:pyridoxal-phosphate dependent enzyme n=1 Tax=Micromonospora sp. AKA38 TaxID=2733861 RepID=UPI0022C456BF|nr:pyridoxal-phosphate dependent enzyme [Micromonospora sp. AKA38]GHJ15491.1 2,3-diaminopropionate biosynthesis protein SbnA [Micromonospora sp. AKA38]